MNENKQTNRSPAWGDYFMMGLGIGTGDAQRSQGLRRRNVC